MQIEYGMFNLNACGLMRGMHKYGGRIIWSNRGRLDPFLGAVGMKPISTGFDRWIRMTASQWCIAAIAICGAAASAVRASNIDVTAWSLSTGIQDNVGQTVHGFGTPMTPFVNFDGVMRGASTAQSAYMIHYARQALSFMLTSDHQCQHTGNFPICTSAGEIVVTTTSAMWFNATSSVDYLFSTQNMAAGVSIGISDYSTGNPVLLFSATDTANTLFDPLVGELTIASQFILPAGGPYRISYQVAAFLDPGVSIGGIATIYGTLNFSLNQVPEPASVFLGAAAAIVAFRRRR